MSCDLEVTNESVRGKEKISSYITLQKYKVTEIVLLLQYGNYTAIHLKYWWSLAPLLLITSTSVHTSIEKKM